MSIWRLVDYDDVWGNQKDGYEINHEHVLKKKLEIPDNATNKEIVQILNDIDYLITTEMRKIRLEDYGNFIEVFEKRIDLPICRLERKFD